METNNSNCHFFDILLSNHLEILTKFFEIPYSQKYINDGKVMNKVNEICNKFNIKNNDKNK